MMTVGDTSIRFEASHLLFFRMQLLGMHLLSHMYMYIDVDSQYCPDRVGVAYSVENENNM